MITVHYSDPYLYYSIGTSRFSLTFRLQGCFGLYGLLLLVYYVTHLKTDPLTNRMRFIIFNKEQERQLGAMVLQYVSK